MAPEGGEEMHDVELACEECGRQFVHTREKQEFYASIGLTNLPKRCPECREKRRNTNRQQRDQRRTPRPAGAGRPPGRGFGGPPRDRGFRSGPPEQFEAVCAACGKQTTLPFKPNGSRPVYCRDCFRQQRPPR
jgi:CxxC-x17-CxxC domain-containing protein